MCVPEIPLYAVVCKQVSNSVINTGIRNITSNYEIKIYAKRLNDKKWDRLRVTTVTNESVTSENENDNHNARTHNKCQSTTIGNGRCTNNMAEKIS